MRSVFGVKLPKAKGVSRRIVLAAFLGLFLLGILGALVITFLPDKSGQPASPTNQKPRIQQIERKNLSAQPVE